MVKHNAKVKRFQYFNRHIEEIQYLKSAVETLSQLGFLAKQPEAKLMARAQGCTPRAPIMKKRKGQTSDRVQGAVWPGTVYEGVCVWDGMTR